jgi:hypothetical protein
MTPKSGHLHGDSQRHLIIPRTATISMSCQMRGNDRAAYQKTNYNICIYSWIFLTIPLIVLVDSL